VTEINADTPTDPPLTDFHLGVAFIVMLAPVPVVGLTGLKGGSICILV
jgi:hypothetical protein